MKPETLKLLFPFVLVLLAGCAVNQQREQAHYRALTQMPAVEAPATTLTLPLALRLANQNNENLAIRGESYLRELIERRRALASFLPTVSLASNYTWLDRIESTGSSSSSGARGSSSGTSGNSGSSGSASGSGGSDSGSGSGSSSGGTGSSGSTAGGSSASARSASSSSNNNDYSYTLNGQLRWNIFNGFRDWNAYWRDTFLIEQRRYDLLNFQEQLLLDVAQDFFNVQRATASTLVLENSLAVQRERLRDTQARLEVGFARSLDVAQTQAQAAGTATTLVNAQRLRDNTREMLALLIGQSLGDLNLEDGWEPPATIDPLEAQLSAATQHRDDLHAADLAITVAERDVKIAIGQYYPSVTLSLDSFLISEPTPNPRDWQAALAATLPVFDGGRIRADVREAWSFLREARLVREYLRRQVEQEVRIAYQNVLASQARQQQLAVQLEAARQAYTQAEASYSVGLATNLDRVAAQDQLLTTELQSTSEQYDYKLFVLRLMHATGRLREAFDPTLTSATPAMAEVSTAAEPTRMPNP